MEIICLQTDERSKRTCPSIGVTCKIVSVKEQQNRVSNNNSKAKKDKKTITYWYNVNKS
jgi:hypothetical protein